MANYKVLSDRLTVGTKGQIIDDEALAGANISALIEGGHLEPVPTGKKTEETPKDK